MAAGLVGKCLNQMPAVSPFTSLSPFRKSIIFCFFSVNDFLIGNRNWTKAVSVDPDVFRYFTYCSNAFIFPCIKKGNTYFSALNDRCRSCTDINFSNDGRAVTPRQDFLIVVACQVAEC